MTASGERALADMSGRHRQDLAIPWLTMETRGQRIRRERRLRRMSAKALAHEVGISERTLRSIELDERPDARTVDLVEAHLGLVDQGPARATSPSLKDATDAEILVELYARLMRVGLTPPAEVPATPPADAELILGPPASQTRRPDERGGDAG